MNTPNTCPHGLRAAPAHSPAVAHRREIPYSRNDDTRTRITDQANTLNATVIARSAATWQSPGREDILAYTNTPNTCPHGHRASPAVAHRREIPSGRNENNRTRYAAGRGRPALPTASPRIGHVVISSVSREIPRGKNENNRTRIIIKIAVCRRY